MPRLSSVLPVLLLVLLSACGGGGGGGGGQPAPPPVAIADADKDGVADDQDVAPNDPLCAAASDASGGKCFLRTLAASSRLKLVGNSAGKLFLYSEEDALTLYGYDLQSRHFTGRSKIGGYTPTTFAYSPDHGRLYVGDDSGKIHCYSETLQECDGVFATLPLKVMGLAAAGKYLVAQDGSGAWATHYVYDKQGHLATKKDWNYYSTQYEWSPGQSRLYFFRDNQSPNDLMYEVIDQSTGAITSSGETPYHGDYSIIGPIRANASGSKILLGSGDIYDAPELTWAGNIGGTLKDAAWVASDQLVTVSTAGARSVLKRYTIDRTKVEELPLDGDLLGIGNAGGKTYLILKMADRIQITAYVPSDDSDNDGVPNLVDKFPLDKTAAVDSDNDGYPDAFLGSYTAADSPTGLTLDAYPFDASCHAREQGDGVNCNATATNPAYMPDQVASDGQGVIFLLNKANNRVYRWSVAANTYLSPIVIGNAVAAPLSTMAYSAEHNRLYFGYANGAITYASLAGDSRETPFAVAAAGVRGLGAAGKYLLVQDDSGAWATHYIFDAQGRLTDKKDWNYFSRYYEWNPSQSRIYFFRDDTSPNDLHYEAIDQATGKISSQGETPYHGSYVIAGPIRVSMGGGRIVLGSGDIYSVVDLTVVKSLGVRFIDAQWAQDGSLFTLAASGLSDSSITMYDPNLSLVNTQAIRGAPKALARIGGKIVAVTQVGDRPQFTQVTP